MIWRRKDGLTDNTQAVGKKIGNKWNALSEQQLCSEAKTAIFPVKCPTNEIKS